MPAVYASMSDSYAPDSHVPAAADVPVAIARLAELGYVHRGTLGGDGREAFDSPPALPRHHLYVCPSHSLAVRNHLLVRDDGAHTSAVT